MVNELCLVKKIILLQKQIPLFTPSELAGGEIVLCIKETSGFAKVFYCGELFTVPSEYLAVWA